MSHTRRHFMRAGGLGLLSLLGLAGGLSSVGAGCGGGCAPDDPPPENKKKGPPTMVYIVRHAEKQKGKDPDLTEEGKIRALKLPEVVPIDELRAIYSTATNRTEQTAAPVSAISGLPVTRMPPDDFEGLRKRVEKHRGHAILVVGHSNTIPPMLQALGVADPVEIPDDGYGDLFVVKVPSEGTSTLERKRFGDAAAAPDDGASG